MPHNLFEDMTRTRFSRSNLTQLEVSKEGIWRTVTGLHNKGGREGEGRVWILPYFPTLFIKGVL